MPSGPKMLISMKPYHQQNHYHQKKKQKYVQHDYVIYSLMRIPSNEHAVETVKSFLLHKCLHTLAVFHPRSKGNIFHGRVVLEILLNDWPNQKYFQKLLKCAFFRNLHEGNLICYPPNPKTAQLQPIKRKSLKLFSIWQFMEYSLDATPIQYPKEKLTPISTFCDFPSSMLRQVQCILNPIES